MSVPDQFLDFLTGLRIRDPVRAADGHLYDRATISEWFETLEAAGRPIVSPGRPPMQWRGPSSSTPWPAGS